MTAIHHGHRLVWGVPVAKGGWQVVGSSYAALTREQTNALVIKTGVGALDERDFQDGYGYFGEFRVNGTVWAAFAHFYRSEEPTPMGKYFVQRDICLAPVDAFKQYGYDTQLFFDTLPPPRVYYKGDEKTDGWRIELKPATGKARLQRLEAVSTDFLAALLTSFLQPQSTIVVWTKPDVSLLTALLLLFPPSLRKAMTFCTTVGEMPAATVQIKGIPSFRSDPASTIVDLDRQIFRQQPRTGVAPLALQLVHSFRDNTLEDLHKYLDEVAAFSSDEHAHEKAVAKWQSRREWDSALKTEKRWSVARGHLELMEDAPQQLRAADRTLVADHLVDAFEPVLEREELIKFVKTMGPDAIEQSRIEARAAARLAREQQVDTRKAIIEALAAALPNARAVRENLAGEMFRQLPPEQRRIELLAAFESLFQQIPPSAMQHVFRDWTFASPPSFDALHRFLVRIQTRGDFDLVEHNERLVSAICSGSAGKIAYALVRGRFRDYDLPHLCELTSKDPDAAAEVIAAGSLNFAEDWQPRVILPMITVIVKASQERKEPTKKNEKLKTSFVKLLERGADEEESPPVDEAMSAAMKWAASHPDLRARVEVVRTRLDAGTAEGSLRDLLMKYPLAWQSTRDQQNARQLLGIIKDKPRWEWYIAGDLVAYREFPLSLFCDVLADIGTPAHRLLWMIAMGVLMDSYQPRGDAYVVLANCLKAVADQPIPDGLSRQVAMQWVPRGQKEFETLVRLLGAFTRGDVESVRRRGLGYLEQNQQATAIASYLENINSALREAVQSPELGRLGALLPEPADIDFTHAERSIERLLLTLDDSTLEKTLKQLAARLRKRRPETGWFSRG
jgi:hypothetical protein